MEEKNFKSLVIEKAKEIFTAYGYKKTTMEDIAKACHKSKGLIYHHYKSKEEIFRINLNNDVNQLLFDLKEKADSQISVKNKFNYFFTTTNAWINDKTNIYNKIVIEIFSYIDVIKDDIENFHSKIINILKIILNEGIAKNNFTLDNIELTAESILQMIIGFSYIPFIQELSFNINNKADINKFINIIYYGLEKR